jgi:hypothetical protein
MDRALIESYAAGADELHRSIRGLSREQLCSFPVPGTWSIQQIVMHLMDSDLIASYRMKRIIAMDGPGIEAYDESAFTARLGYERSDPEMACEVFRLNRLMTAAVLRALPDGAFHRTGVHEERGRITLADLLRIYTEHLPHHLRFVRDKRAMLGKPL